MNNNNNNNNHNRVRKTREVGFTPTEKDFKTKLEVGVLEECGQRGGKILVWNNKYRYRLNGKKRDGNKFVCVHTKNRRCGGKIFERINDGKVFIYGTHSCSSNNNGLGKMLSSSNNMNFMNDNSSFGQNNNNNISGGVNRSNIRPPLFLNQQYNNIQYNFKPSFNVFGGTVNAYGGGMVSSSSSTQPQLQFPNNNNNMNFNFTQNKFFNQFQKFYQLQQQRGKEKGKKMIIRNTMNELRIEGVYPFQLNNRFDIVRLFLYYPDILPRKLPNRENIRITITDTSNPRNFVVLDNNIDRKNCPIRFVGFSNRGKQIKYQRSNVEITFVIPEKNRILEWNGFANIQVEIFNLIGINQVLKTSKPRCMFTVSPVLRTNANGRNNINWNTLTGSSSSPKLNIVQKELKIHGINPDKVRCQQSSMVKLFFTYCENSIPKNICNPLCERVNILFGILKSPFIHTCVPITTQNQRFAPSNKAKNYFICESPMSTKPGVVDINLIINGYGSCSKSKCFEFFSDRKMEEVFDGEKMKNDENLFDDLLNEDDDDIFGMEEDPIPEPNYNVEIDSTLFDEFVSAVFPDIKSSKPNYVDFSRVDANVLRKALSDFCDVHSCCGFTLFHICCSSKIYYLVPLLVECGYNMNIGDRWGNSPLHWANYFGDENMIDLLISFGADTEKKNQFGERYSNFRSLFLQKNNNLRINYVLAVGERRKKKKKDRSKVHVVVSGKKFLENRKIFNRVVSFLNIIENSSMEDKMNMFPIFSLKCTCKTLETYVLQTIKRKIVEERKSNRCVIVDSPNFDRMVKYNLEEDILLLMIRNSVIKFEEVEYEEIYRILGRKNYNRTSDLLLRSIPFSFSSFFYVALNNQKILTRVKNEIIFREYFDDYFDFISMTYLVAKEDLTLFKFFVEEKGVKPYVGNNIAIREVVGKNMSLEWIKYLLMFRDDGVDAGVISNHCLKSAVKNNNILVVEVLLQDENVNLMNIDRFYMNNRIEFDFRFDGIKESLKLSQEKFHLDRIYNLILNSIKTLEEKIEIYEEERVEKERAKERCKMAMMIVEKQKQRKKLKKNQKKTKSKIEMKQHRLTRFSDGIKNGVKSISSCPMPDIIDSDDELN